MADHYSPIDGSLLPWEVDAFRQDNAFEFEDEGRFFREAKGIMNLDGSTPADVDEVIYEGSCSFMPIVARRDRFDEFGEGLIYQVQYRVLIPWNVTGIRITDRFILTETRDPDLLSRNFEVRDVHRTTDIGQRRITVHDIER
jgi:hypothetical protein